VKNTGKMAAAETVQIYIGMETSAVIRPKKELVAFAKAELLPGYGKNGKKRLRFLRKIEYNFIM